MYQPAVLHLCLEPLAFFFYAPATTDIYTLSLHDALPIYILPADVDDKGDSRLECRDICEVLFENRSEEHTSELQSLRHLVCRLLLEKKKHELRPPPSHLRCRLPDFLDRREPTRHGMLGSR